MSEINEYPVIFEQKVAWGDMDAFGHVNNVIYYRYIESARIQYFDHLGLFELDINTVVGSSQCKYLKPVYYPDTLKIGCRVVEIRNSAFRMEYLLFSQTQQEVVATAEAVMVCVDKISGQKALLPDKLRNGIIGLEGK